MQSADSLIWLLVKDNNSFLHKRARTSRAGGVQFSSEPGNLLSVNSFKYSGLANSKAIDISVDSNKKINLRLKNTKKAQKPSKSIATVPLRRTPKSSGKALLSQACSSFYRADLATAASARYNKLYRDVRVRNGILKATRAKAGRNSR